MAEPPSEERGDEFIDSSPEVGAITALTPLPPVSPGQQDDGLTGTENALELPHIAVYREAVREMESLLLRGTEGAQASELAARLAVIALDHRDGKKTERFLELAKEHPLAFRLTLGQSLSTASSDDLNTAQMMVDAFVSDRGERVRAYRDLTIAWLYRFNRPDRAARAARAGLDIVIPGDVERSELQELFYLALATAAQWTDYVNFLAGNVATADEIPQTARLTMFVEAVHAAMDRLDRSDLATKMIRRRFALLEQGEADAASPGLYYHATLQALAAASSVDQRDRINRRALLEKRLELAEELADEAEATQARVELAGMLSRKGDNARATEIATGLTDTADPSRLVTASKISVFARAEAWAIVVDLLLELADGDQGPAGCAYLRRAAEIAEAREVPGIDAEALWQRVLEISPGDPQAESHLERLSLLAKRVDLASELSQRAEARQWVSGYWRAAALLEEQGSAEAALELIARALDSSERDAQLGELLELARLSRQRGDIGRLCDVYRQAAAVAKRSVHEEDAGISAVLLCAAGVASLSEGRLSDAKACFADALAIAEGDVVSLVGLVEVARSERKHEELAQRLLAVADRATSPDLVVEALVERARVLAQKMRKSEDARTCLERALTIKPEDPVTLRSLALLSDSDSDWNRAVEFRNRALSAGPGSDESSALLLEIGSIHEKQQHDDDEALAAYERALAADPKSLEAIRGASRIYRKKGDYPKLLALLRSELDLVDEPRTVAGCYLDIARIQRELAEPPEVALASYRDALKVEPESAAALDGIEEVARDLGRFDVVAEAFRKAPPTRANLAVLSEALGKLGNWGEFVTVRRREVELREDPEERARLLLDLARVAEEELHDLDRAIGVHREIIQLRPDHADAQPELARLLEVRQNWPDLETEYTAELQRLGDGDVERRVVIGVRLAELRHNKLANMAGAVDAYRDVLRISPHNEPALVALDSLFEELGDAQGQLEILETRARATDEAEPKANLLVRAAELVKDSDPANAASLYLEAFRATPANRAYFTSIEEFCYERELWPEVMELYNRSISLVEDDAVRAYRLSDLYSRRGQVELQYLNRLEAAAASYSRVAELEPDNDTALRFLESIYSKLDDWTGLLDAYRNHAGRIVDPDQRGEVYRRAARVAVARLQDQEQAGVFYESVLEVEPADPEALDALEQFALEARDWNKLVEVLKKRLDSAPAGDAATKLLKRIARICEERLRDEERAITYYQRILQIAPGNKGALEALSRIYESTERWADFVEATRRQIKVTVDRPHKALLYFKCGSVVESKFGEEDEAIRYYEAAIKTSPACMPAVHGLRDLYRRREDWNKVIQSLELEVKLWDDDKERAGVFAQIGNVYGQQLLNHSRAMHYYESALAVDPECLPANRALFDEYFAAGSWSQAQPLADALSQKAMREGDPNSRAEFYRKRGVVAWRTGDASAAADSLLIALEIRPDNLSALDNLGELSRENPRSYDFASAYRELARIYRRRDDGGRFLARVSVGQAALAERRGDLEAAESLLAEALAHSPGEFVILSELIDLHLRMRRWNRAIDAITRFLESGQPPDTEVRAQTLLKQAEIHSECEMDPHRSIRVLREVIRLDPEDRYCAREAHYRLAQGLCILGRYDEAREAISKVIDLAATPGKEVSAPTLARYYFYFGRILEAADDSRAAAAQYRRASDYDPAYAEPILALAKRAAARGDIAGAQTLLINSAHAAIEAAGRSAAVPLQRGLARLQLAAGDPASAIDAYRGILAVSPDEAADRVALAELYVYHDLRKAIRELVRVLDRDIRFAPAYRQLAALYNRAGRPERAARVFSVMETLGFSDEKDRGVAKANPASPKLAKPLDDSLRKRLLVTELARSVRGEIFDAMAAEVAALFPTPPLGHDLQPIQAGEHPEVHEIVEEICSLFATKAEVYAGDSVPGGLVALSEPNPIVILDRRLLHNDAAVIRFFMGFACEAIRGRYAVLLSMTRRQMDDMTALLAGLNRESKSQTQLVTQFIAALPRRATKLLEKVRDAEHASPGAWIDGLLASARRGGLLACDDFIAATRALALLAGHELPPGDKASAGLGAVICGEDLVRHYLSDDYHWLRHTLVSGEAS